ncbi:3-beta hydroxysteroid dehydrogenase/isomerase [Gloeophyllum trabeum ATCC 11539]|uniref:3-beta hydroxysteroid dehydrogenase/isomerase n=1 Tax=Gloeophyllum trabeum (strain ATCC 11539 / FP-39264 / Madison 617) TaxID=670483 RepID=S7Q4V1_GLOTA|nr:3-beta hydroxysteroid dehydrogenase/isomerase [Gloeophyllum trabeum ATCC 11539]EPQ54527.1 3-beta hydroxysteroid dehydrogenase/isomerase [Gloeophyllum trabeum ATCC 11539]
MSTQPKDIYLVIGGSGFLGRHIVDKLLARGDSVSIFDIVQRYHDVPFYSGDISEEAQVAQAVQKSGATCIMHVASPPHGIDDPALYWKVNVDGTQAVINAAIANGVRKLVFTSSAGVVFNGEDLVNIDERLTPPEKSMDAYNESKAKGEQLVLAANGKGGLLTVALRPSGIFGPGDRQVMHGLSQVFARNQTHFQIGDNTNLFDWTYVTNVAHAHLLAADKLVPPKQLTEEETQSIINYYLPTVSLTTGSHRQPTSVARPLGPYVEPPPDAEEIKARFESPDPKAPYTAISHPRPVVRSRFDPLSDQAIARAREHASLTRKEKEADADSSVVTDPLQVAGQVFFITNGEPTYFWDFPRAVWRSLRASSPDAPPERGRITFPREVGMALAYAAEWWGWLVGKEPAFTRFRVTFSCVHRWHNIEKARRVLGYEPEVGLEEGVKRMVEWWKSEHGTS